MMTSFKLMLISLLTIALLALSGCNTFKGMGQDIESVGESMQNAGD